MCEHHEHNHISKSGLDEKTQDGSALEHGKLHDKAHKSWSRRNFLLTGGLAAIGSSLTINGLNIHALARSPLLAALSNANTDRVLVLIRLKGGNDGLNTIIPVYDYGTYTTHRPDIALPMGNIVMLDNDAGIGMHNGLTNLHPLWLAGKMKVIHNVAYPQQNLSHFRSSDIWSTASNTNEYWSSGWLGRFLEQEYPAYLEAPPSVPPAIQIGSESNLMFRGENTSMSLVINNPNEFYQIAQSGQLYDTENLPDCFYGSELGFMRQVTNSSFRYSQAIKSAYDSSTAAVTYPSNNSLATNLAIIARLIKGNLGTKVYMVSIDGFDTHANQLTGQNTLFNRIGNAVQAFYNDLQATGHNQDVLIATHSEFGRRVFQNGSFGTDHGEAAPVILLGDGLEGNGFVGTAPNIAQSNWVGPGNIPYEIDFRRIYSTLLQDWFCMHPAIVDAVLGHVHTRIEGLVNACQPSIGSNDTAVLLGHQPDYSEYGATTIKYAILSGGTVRLRIMNKASQPLVTLFNSYHDKGSYKFHFNWLEYNLPAGEYIYQLDSGGKTYNRLFAVGE